MQQGFDMQQLIRLAQSPTGQQLIAALKNADSAKTTSAAAMAAAGDMDKAKQTLSSLLEDETIRSLLQQLGGQL